MRYRVGLYIDGFNLYHGLRDATGRKHLWLDLEALAHALCRDDQDLQFVKYYTAEVRDAPLSEARQATYLAALGAHTDVQTFRGRFQRKQLDCRRCKRVWQTYEEKETDVAIAAALIEDGVTNMWDTAIIVSGDSDLCPAVRAVRRLKPTTRLVVAFPPRRHSDDLRRSVHANFTIGIAKFRQSQLPDPVSLPDGRLLHRPAHWK